jgi:quercetin dioxygenase-like cupin family protein
MPDDPNVFETDSWEREMGPEELLIVLDGELELRTPEGKRTVSTGAVVGFPAGTEADYIALTVAAIEADK